MVATFVRHNSQDFFKECSFGSGPLKAAADGCFSSPEIYGSAASSLSLSLISPDRVLGDKGVRRCLLKCSSKFHIFQLHFCSVSKNLSKRVKAKGETKKPKFDASSVTFPFFRRTTRWQSQQFFPDSVPPASKSEALRWELCERHSGRDATLMLEFQEVQQGIVSI